MRRLGLPVLAWCAVALSGCGLQTRGAAGVSQGYDALDLTIGVLPIGVSLNQSQNMFPGVAAAMDRYQLFRSIEPSAASPNKKFDLLMIVGEGVFAPEVKVVSGYSNKELFREKVMALYGAGAKKAVYDLAKAFAVGKPAYQEIMAEREIYRKQGQRPAETAPATAATVVSDVDEPAYHSAARPDDYAVVVGIERYADLPEARFAVRDAQAVREHLKALGLPERNIVLLTGERASKAGLAKNLETWLVNNVKEDSTVFFYYSGHGAPEPATGQAYLVPFDGDPQYLSDTAYPLKRLYQKLGELKVKRVVVALDACFSGAGGRSVLAKGIKPLVSKVVLDVPAQGKLVALSASAAAQVSGTSEEQGHGLFTYYLLKGLNGAAQTAGSGVTVRSLFDYLSPNVQDEARRQNREQTPQLQGQAAGVRLR
ncbi:MAG: caspase family protein [Elusimicrobia bacterium]|nr:caspase family protein [Elusimicrobiota bacterium]